MCQDKAAIQKALAASATRNLLKRTGSIEKSFYRAPMQKALPASATRISLSPGSDSAWASCIRNRAVNARLIFTSMHVGMMYACCCLMCV